MEPDKKEQKILSFGEDAVGLTFNPGGSTKVDAVKRLYSVIIDMLNDERSTSSTDEHPERKRLLSVAITEAQTAQMWAVKGITK